jgi:hypothetical protein
MSEHAIQVDISDALSERDKVCYLSSYSIEV